MKGDARTQTLVRACNLVEGYIVEPSPGALDNGQTTCEDNLAI